MFSISKNLTNSLQNNVISVNMKTNSENCSNKDLTNIKNCSSNQITNKVSRVMTAASGLLDQSGDKKRVSYVTAACDIPLGVMSSDTKLDDVLNNADSTYKNNMKNDLPVQIRVSHSNGRLIPALDEEYEEKNGICTVLNNIKLADDCHSFNVILQVGDKSKTIKLTTTQTISKGQKLLLWFSPEILATLCVPFLTPVNILGEKNYKCHKCRKTFEYPNPLKIHLSLDCRNVSVKNIWKRLNASITKYEQNKFRSCESSGSHDIINNLNSLNNFSFSLKNTIKNSTEELDLSNKNSCKSQTPLPSPELTTVSNPSPFNVEAYEDEREKVSNRPSSVPLQHQSAFRPYSTNKLLPIQNELLNPYLPAAFSLFSNNLNSFLTPQNKYMVGSPINFTQDSVDQRNLIVQQAVDMETFVSNLGKSKQGHLCIYCGKIYSRKYGLKIHIRTHTGFKPLKCKYCLRPFGDPSNLNKHVRLHAEGETPYKCELCGKILVRRRDLDRHMKSRHQNDYSFTNEESNEVVQNINNIKTS